MGRIRTTDRGWPKGWYLKGKTIYFRLAKYRDIIGSKPIKLGLTEKEAYKTFSQLPIHGNSDSLLLSDVMARYEIEVLPNNAARTQENKRYYIKYLRKSAGHFKVTQIKQSHAWTLFEALKKARGLKTARETVSCLRHVLSMCVKWGLVDQNLLLGMRLEKPKARTRYVTDKELGLFVSKYATERVMAHIALKLETGMDKQDILLIAHSDAQADGLHHARHKTEAVRKIYAWTPELVKAYDQLKKAYRKKKGDIGSRWVCKTREGAPYFPIIEGQVLDAKGHPFGAPSGWNSQWQRCMVKWKEDGYEGFHEHDIRKKVASDTTLANAQELLDHTNPAMTEKYRVKTKIVKLEKNSYPKSE